MPPTATPSESSKRKRDSTEQHSKKRTRTDYSDAITVLVGQEKQPVIVHKDVLCRQSKFFAAACSREWMEGREKTVPLPSVRPLVFNRYLDWLYKGKLELSSLDSPEAEGLPKPSRRSGKEMRKTETNCNAAITTLATNLYVAADMLLDSSFARAILDTLLQLSDLDQVEQNPAILLHVWNNTAHDSGLRRLHLDLLIFNTKEPAAWLAECKTCLPEDFIFDLAVRQLAVRQLQQQDKSTSSCEPYFENRCNYHDHRNEDERRQCSGSAYRH